jgi:putative transposase
MENKMNNRQSNRLKEFDYTNNGAYFITILTQDRIEQFGEIVNGEMILNDAGRMIDTVWNDLPKLYPNIDIDESIIMPNHFHGIVIINNTVGAAPCGRPGITDNDNFINNDLKDENEMNELIYKNEINNPKNQKELIYPNELPDHGRPQGDRPYGLSDAINRFKSFTTHRYSNGVKMGLVKPFNKRLWQRNYYDHIIRNENEQIEIRKYIINNPLSWELDRFGDDSNSVQEDRPVYDDDWRIVC